MESSLTLTIHGIQLTATLSVLAIVLREHKVWVRMKDRLNQLWKDRCVAHSDDYVPLENGRH